MKNYFLLFVFLLSVFLVAEEKLEFKAVGNFRTTDGAYSIYFEESGVVMCFSCNLDSEGDFIIYDKSGTGPVTLSCDPVMYSSTKKFDKIEMIEKQLPIKKIKKFGVIPWNNPKYLESLESQRDILRSELGIYIKTIDVYKTENDDLIRSSKGLEESVKDYKRQLGEIVKPSEREGEPRPFILAPAKKLNVAPYRQKDPWKGIEVLGLPSEVEEYYYQQWQAGEYQVDYLKRGDFLEAMAYRSSKRGVVAVANFLADWPDSVEYKVYIYEPYTYYGKVYQFGIVDTCNNPFTRYVFDCEPKYFDTGSTVIETLVINDTIPCPPELRQLEPPSEPEEEQLWRKIQSYAYTGVSFPVPGPRYNNAWLGIIFDYYFPKRESDGYSRPHSGFSGSFNSYRGSGLPDSAASKIKYYGFEGDLGLKVCFPIKKVAFMFGAYYGFEYDRCRDAFYKGRQSTHLIILRENFDIYGDNIELLSYGQFTIGARGRTLSSWMGNSLTKVQDPATSRSSIYLGAKVFFGPMMKMDYAPDISGDGFGEIPVQRKVNPGFFVLQGINYEGVLSRRDKTKAYTLSFGPCLRFNKPKIIFSTGAKYAWSFEKYPNRWAIMTSLEKNISRKIWGREKRKNRKEKTEKKSDSDREKDSISF